MNRSYAFRQTGFTLTELLVVLVIISILSTIAVPVYINKAENARIATAQAECRQIAEAEDACAIQHGFYVPLQLLDDLPPGTGMSLETDTIDFEPSTIFLIDPAKSRFQLGINQPSLMVNSSDPRVVKLIRDWQGPFLNPQRVFIGNASSADNMNLQGELKRLDYPLDPWGQPYRFYSPQGLIGSGANSTDPNYWRLPTFSDGKIPTTGNDQGRFDRYAIVSWGPDGIPNTMSPDVRDDVVYQFGRVNAFRTETDSSNGTITIPSPTPIPN